MLKLPFYQDIHSFLGPHQYTYSSLYQTSQEPHCLSVPGWRTQRVCKYLWKYWRICHWNPEQNCFFLWLWDTEIFSGQLSYFYQSKRNAFLKISLLIIGRHRILIFSCLLFVLFEKKTLIFYTKFLNLEILIGSCLIPTMYNGQFGAFYSFIICMLKSVGMSYFTIQTIISIHDAKNVNISLII